MADKRFAFSVTIKCHFCGQAGYVIWEEAGAFDRTRGSQRTLVHVSSGFHSEIGRTRSGDPLIICNECDTIQED
jgi:hypothetical protein